MKEHKLFHGSSGYREGALTHFLNHSSPKKRRGDTTDEELLLPKKVKKTHHDEHENTPESKRGLEKLVEAFNEKSRKVVVEKRNEGSSFASVDLGRRLAEGLRKAQAVEERKRQVKGSRIKRVKIPKVSTDEEAEGRESKGGEGEAAEDDHDCGVEKEEMKLNRTLFIGNVPLDATLKDLRRTLDLPNAQVESARFRSIPVHPKFVTNKKAGVCTGQYADTSDVKNAYLVMKTESQVRDVLARRPVVTLEGKRLRLDKVEVKGGEKNFSKFDRKRCVFVGGMPLAAKEDDLMSLFEAKVGPVTNVRIIRDKATSLSKGFGFVLFRDRISVAKATAASASFSLQGRSLNVRRALVEEEAKEVQKKKAETRKKNALKKRSKKMLPAIRRLEGKRAKRAANRKGD